MIFFIIYYRWFEHIFLLGFLENKRLKSLTIFNAKVVLEDFLKKHEAIILNTHKKKIIEK